MANGTYNSGDVIQLELSFPKTLTVDESLGTPYLDFDLGETSVNANYISGSGSSTIVFEYTVSNGQVDDDGVAPTGNITLNG